ncbi:MAG: hypothetical protein Q9221_008066 [Calogaya cf. arnoldii]
MDISSFYLGLNPVHIGPVHVRNQPNSIEKLTVPYVGHQDPAFKATLLTCRALVQAIKIPLPPSESDDVEIIRVVDLTTSRMRNKEVDIVQAVNDWIHSYRNIRSAPETNGGWERWAHMDLSLSLQSAGHTATCEAKCYENPKLRCDLLIHHPATSGSTPIASPRQRNSPVMPSHSYDLVELKCHLKGETMDNFHWRLRKDVQKLLNEPLMDAFRRLGAQKRVIGLSTHKPSYEHVHQDFWHGPTRHYFQHSTSAHGLFITAWHTTSSPSSIRQSDESCLCGPMDWSTYTDPL